MRPLLCVRSFTVLVLLMTLLPACRSEEPAITLISDMDTVYEATVENRYDDAYERLRRLFEREPYYAPAGIWYARLSLRKGEYGDARNTLETLLRSHPESVDALHLFALLAQREGDVETALSAFEAATERLETYARVYLDRARLYVQLGLFREAQECIERMRGITSEPVLTRQADELLQFMTADTTQ